MDETLSISQKINYQYGEAYALGHIGYHKYLEGSQEQADSLFRLADSIAQKIGDLDLIAMIMTRLGQRKANQGDKQGMDLLYKAEKIFERSKNYQWLVRCQVTIASVNQVTYSNYPVAMEYLLKAMGSAEKTNSSDAMYSVWSNLGGTYFFIGDYENALHYFDKALEAAEKDGADIGKTSLFNNIGEVYRLMGKYPEAIEFYTKSLRADSSLYNVDLYESNLADVYVRLNNLPLAFQYAFSSLAKAEQIKDHYILAWVHGVLARAYLKKNMSDSSIYYANRGFAYSVKIGSIEYMRDNTEALANAYAFQKDFSNAYKYHLQYINYRDSMLSAEVKNMTLFRHRNFLQIIFIISCQVTHYYFFATDKT